MKRLLEAHAWVGSSRSGKSHHPPEILEWTRRNKHECGVVVYDSKKESFAIFLEMQEITKEQRNA